MTKARQSLKKRVAQLERSVHASTDRDEQERLLVERERLQARRGIVAAAPPSSQEGTEK